MKPKFELFQSSSNSNFYFLLKVTDKEITLRSENYTTKVNCLKGIEAVKVNAASDANYDREIAGLGLFYFKLIAQNHHVIGTSKIYFDARGRNNGIEVVKRKAPLAEVVDLTEEILSINQSAC